MTHDVHTERAVAAKLAYRDNPAPFTLVEQLGVALENLETQLDRLDERLTPVLVEREPSAALTGEPAPGRTLLAQRLTHLATWAERLNGKAAELHDRVEL